MLSKFFKIYKFISPIQHLSHRWNHDSFSVDDARSQQWKIIPNYTKYEISTTGSIRKRSTQRVMKPYDKETLLVIGLVSDKGCQRQHSVARLVLSTFQPIESTPNGIKVCAAHKDGNRHNNDLTNLEWQTPSNVMRKMNSNHKSMQAARCTPVILLMYSKDILVNSKQCASIKECIQQITRFLIHQFHVVVQILSKLCMTSIPIHVRNAR